MKKLFPNKNINKVVKKIHVSISKNAQVVTDFEFQKTNIALMKKINIFLANMSNVYPDERSINNALKIGEDLIENIQKNLYLKIKIFLILISLKDMKVLMHIKLQALQ